MADLFDLQSVGSDGRQVPAGLHGASKGSFNKERLGFAYDIFINVRDALRAAGLLLVSTGKPRWHPAFDNFLVRGGDATTYKLTDTAISLAVSFGISSADWSVHWRRTGEQPIKTVVDVPRLVLRKKSGRVAGKKKDVEDWPFSPDEPKVRSILTGIDQLNDFLAEQAVDGFAFLGLRRIFNNGDQADFDWNKGGRYYSLPGGHLYEAWGADKRRATIRLNGEAVEEVDLRASHLTLVHALQQRPFDPHDDPYAIPGWPRAVVKAWVSQAIGASNPRPRQWSKAAQADYEAERPGRFLSDEFPISEIGASVTSRHPLLVDLKTCGFGTLDLQYHEAEILRLAMEDLMLKRGIAVLPMHDAIIAPRSKLGEARDALLQAFADQVEGVTGHPSLVAPKVTTKD
ncbi:hypothetical protein MACH24_31580 [Erythrobacter sp. Dej080120_24]|uniref:hypothetical protein n=1 Tax=Erythrobacter sp. Dej080120_24 TaxID=3024837 RepID=UPI002926EAF4|nr:hypothetical protein MACH24_31580 [Erythrobacter sp. Dej080120_24]